MLRNKWKKLPTASTRVAIYELKLPYFVPKFLLSTDSCGIN